MASPDSTSRFFAPSIHWTHSRNLAMKVFAQLQRALASSEIFHPSCSLNGLELADGEGARRAHSQKTALARKRWCPFDNTTHHCCAATAARSSHGQSHPLPPEKRRRREPTRKAPSMALGEQTSPPSMALGEQTLPAISAILRFAETLLAPGICVSSGTGLPWTSP